MLGGEIMIYKNALFHNVYEFDECEDGIYFCRAPLSVEHNLNDVAKKTNRYSTGVEIRFVMLSDEVEITLSKPKLCEGDPIMSHFSVYFGNIPAGWADCERYFNKDKTKCVIHKPDDRTMALLDKMSKEQDYPFSPNVVRVVMESASARFHDISGDIRVPHDYEMPSKKCLFYGSSITNGALALKTSDCFAYRIAEKFNMDYNNLGYSGSAHCEPEMAEYIASLSGYSFISLEMGGNMYGFSIDEYKSRVKNFVNVAATAHYGIPIFCVDMFYCREEYENGDESKTKKMRKALNEALSELGLKNTIYVPGNSLLSSLVGLTADFTHPGIEGSTEIFKNYSAIIEKYL